MGADFYISLYYGTVLACVALLPLFAIDNRGNSVGDIKAFFVIAILATYFVAMLRTRGVDMANYIYAFEVDPAFIPDPGFSALIRIFVALGLPFSAVLIFIGVVNIVALKIVARRFRVDFALLLVLWFLHTAVVRDFGQVRIALAASLCLMAISARSIWLRSGLYLAAVSVHYSTAAFVVAYEVCARVAGVRSAGLRYAMVALLAASILALGLMLQQLAFLDERIALYLAWEQSGYGAPVESFGSLILHSIVLAIALWAYRHFPKDDRGDVRTLVYLQIAGIVTFVGLSSVAIFAFRLSNVILSLYPLLVLISLEMLRPTVAGRSAAPLASGLTLLIFAAVLIMRPGSYEIIGRIGF